MTSHRTRSNAWKILSMMPLALALIQCGDKENCDQLREEFYQKRTAWGQCTIDEEVLPACEQSQRLHRRVLVFLRRAQSSPRGGRARDAHERRRQRLLSRVRRPQLQQFGPSLLRAGHTPVRDDRVLDASSRFGPPVTRDVQAPPPPDDEDAGTD